MRDWTYTAHSNAPSHQTPYARAAATEPPFADDIARARPGEAVRLAEIQRLTTELQAIEARLRLLRQPAARDADTAVMTAVVVPSAPRASQNPDAMAADQLMRRYVRSH